MNIRYYLNILAISMPHLTPSPKIQSKHFPLLLLVQAISTISIAIPQATYHCFLQPNKPATQCFADLDCYICPCVSQISPLIGSALPQYFSRLMVELNQRGISITAKNSNSLNHAKLQQQIAKMQKRFPP